jgi:hypothetical protein
MRSEVIHYYGFSYKEVESMPYQTFLEFYDSIEVIEAKKALLSMKIASYPYMPTKDRNKMHRKMHEKAFPETHSNKKALTTKDAFMALMRG